MKVASQSEFVFDIKKHMNLTNREKDLLEDFEVYDETKWFIDVAQLSEGQSFGELALI